MNIVSEHQQSIRCVINVRNRGGRVKGRFNNVEKKEVSISTGIPSKDMNFQRGTFQSDHILVHRILPEVYQREGSTTEAANETSLKQKFLLFI